MGMPNMLALDEQAASGSKLLSKQPLVQNCRASSLGSALFSKQRLSVLLGKQLVVAKLYVLIRSCKLQNSPCAILLISFQTPGAKGLEPRA
eukprot:1139197-Pelagomonas_calceolata.AAC.6